MSRSAISPTRLLIVTTCAAGLLLAGCSAGGPPVAGEAAPASSSPGLASAGLSFPATGPSAGVTGGSADTGAPSAGSLDTSAGSEQTDTEGGATGGTDSVGAGGTGAQSSDVQGTSGAGSADTSTSGPPQTAPAKPDLFQSIDSTAGLQLAKQVRIDPAAATLTLPDFTMQLTRVAQVAKLPGDSAEDNPDGAQFLVPTAGYHLLLFSVRGTSDTQKADAAYEGETSSVESDSLRQVNPPEISLVNGPPQEFGDLQDTETSYLISVRDGGTPKLSATFDDRTFSLDIATATLDADAAGLAIMADAKRYQQVGTTGPTTKWTIAGPSPDAAIYTPTLTSLTRTAWDPVSGWAKSGNIWIQALVSTAGEKQIFGNTEQYTQDNRSWTVTVDGKNYKPTGTAAYTSEVFNTDRGLAWFQIPATAKSVTVKLSTTLSYTPYDKDDNKLAPAKRTADVKPITVTLQ